MSGHPNLAAEDLEQVIVEFIASAKTRLDIAVQEIDSRSIAQGVGHQGCGRGGVDRPANHLTRAGVQDHRAVQLALTGGMLGVGVGSRRPASLSAGGFPYPPSDRTCPFPSIRLSTCSCRWCR
jgi:hypothetical protein